MRGCLREGRLSSSCTGSPRPRASWAPGHGACRRTDARSLAVAERRRGDVRRDAPQALDVGSSTDTYVGYSLGGRLVPAARARPTRGRAPARAGERVAGHRRPSRSARHVARPTSGSRRRSSATASTRSSSAGSRNRCSRRCRASAAASTSGGHGNTVERLTHQLRVLGQGVATVELGTTRRARDAGAPDRGRARHQVRRDRPAAWRTRSRDARVEVVAGAGPRVPPRASRDASLTCSSSWSATPSRSRSGSTARTGSMPSTGTSGSCVTSPASTSSGREPARVRQLRQRGRERHARGDPDRRLHHRAHHRGDARSLRDLERGAHARRAAAA